MTRRGNIVLAASVFVPAFAVYAITAPRTVGWQDSGLFLAAIRDLGVPYEPGFPVYIVAAKLFTYLTAFLDFTLRVHLFSAACGAGAAAVVALLA
ncbi:DUF2723 domain-containing protein, partial [bacterium]|nr:DUF2723 domain-containing protein [bacterium]